MACFRQYSDCGGVSCPLWFCFLLRTEMENAKRSLGFLHHYYGSPIPFFQMAAVGRVVSLGYGYHSFLCVVFRRGGLKKASCPFYYPHHQKSKIAKRFRKIFCGASRIAGFGEGTPQQDLPQGQNRRYADFGTVVESCSKKLPLSSTADFAAIRRGRLGLFPSI